MGWHPAHGNGFHDTFHYPGFWYRPDFAQLQTIKIFLSYLLMTSVLGFHHPSEVYDIGPKRFGNENKLLIALLMLKFSKPVEGLRLFV